MDEPKTDKGARTRQRLLDTAIEHFATHGYGSTTMRGIASDAGVSASLAYRYFEGKPAFVEAMYARLAADFVAQTELPEGRWAARALAALDGSLAVLAPHRETLAVLLTSSTDDPTLSPALTPSAADVQTVFTTAVTEARDTPSNPESLAELLYIAHLGVIMFWVLDRSEGQSATAALRRWAEGLLPTIALAWSLPGVSGWITPLTDIVWQGLGAPLPRDGAPPTQDDTSPTQT